MNRLSVILFIVAFVFGIVYYNTWVIILEVYEVSIYHKCVAFEFLILFYGITLNLKGRLEILFKAITSVVGAKFIDELLLDPTLFEWSEVIITIVGFILLLFKKRVSLVLTRLKLTIKNKLKNWGLYVKGNKRRFRKD